MACDLVSVLARRVDGLIRIVVGPSHQGKTKEESLDFWFQG